MIFSQKIIAVICVCRKCKAVVMPCFRTECATICENSTCYLFLAAQPNFSIHPVNKFNIFIRYVSKINYLRLKIRKRGFLSIRIRLTSTISSKPCTSGRKKSKEHRSGPFYDFASLSTFIIKTLACKSFQTQTH